MKRTLSLILALVMLLGMLPMGVFADTTDFKLYFETDVTDASTLEIGDKITVTAYLANNPGFAGMKTKLTWDNSVVQFDGFTTETFRNQEYLVSEVIADATYSQTAGTVVVGETTDLTANGKLWEAVFTVLKDGDTRIALSTDGDDFQMVNAATTKLSPTIDQTALDALIVPTHIHDYTHETEVVAPTCTEGGYTKHTCACGDFYTDTATSATGHNYVDGTCSVCGAAGTIIPEGAPFIDMLTSDGQIVTVTAMGTEPVYGMGPLYKVEVPLGTTQVNVTYPEDAVALTGFGYSANIMIGFANVTDDGYGATKKDGKITVGLAMEKAAANGSPTTIKLINVPYGDEPRSVGFYDSTGVPTHFLAFTYKLGNGQHFAALPEGIGYTATGEPIASDGYTFNVSIDDGYEATADFAVKVNGETVATEEGSVSVPSVQEDLIITVEGVAKIVDPTTDISITLDLNGYTGAINASMSYSTKLGESNEVVVEAGKSGTLSLDASDNSWFGVYVSDVSPLVLGWDINGTAYYYPNEYTTYSLASGVSMSMNTDGYFNINTSSTSPYQAVVKPIVGTSESVGAAPDFAEPGTIDVTDIAVIGADVVSYAWEGDTLNVILAEDTAADASFRTLWTIYANNTKEGATQPCFNINGILKTPSGTEATIQWGDGVSLTEGVATKTYAFEVAEMSWNPESALEFTNKTFTINFYVSGKEPAPTYTVSIDEEITGGTVIADPTSAEEGAEITLTVTPDDGYILKTLTVTDDSEEEVTVTDNKFTMPASNVTVSAVFEEETSEPESSLPFTITVDGTEMEPTIEGEETCPYFTDPATKLVLTVPSNANSVTLMTSRDYMAVYGDKNDEEATVIVEGAESTATLNIADGYVYYDINFGEEAFHLYIEVEGSAEPEPTPEYKSEYGITVMVGDEEMDLVANGTETCGVLQATKLNVTVPAGTTEVKFLNITETVMYGQMYVYNGAHNWEEFASNVTEATISLADCGTSFCVQDSANAWYHVNITVEEPAPSYKSEYGITVMVGDEEMDLIANGTETCGTMQAQKLNVTVPAGTTEVKFLNITDKVQWSQMYVYNGAHNWEEFASNVTEATISLTECGTSFCVSDSANAWYHVNITVEEPAPSYKSSYGITVMVGDEEMDLVANGTETCGVMQAQKLNVTVPAGTTEVKFLNITDKVQWSQMYVYSGAHNWTEYASNVTEATISLTECGTSFCVSDSANAWYHVNITVEEPEIEPNPITKIEVSHPGIQKDETTGALSMTVYPGASKNLDMNFTVANAQLEATQIVFWSSDNEDAVTVDQNGTVTAKAPGTAVITAKAVDPSGVAAAAEGDEVMAQVTVTVPDVDNTEEQSYTVQMPGDSDVTVGETVSIPLTVGHTGDVSIFNSYDITVTYDASLLELTSTEIEGATVTDGEGTVNVKRYGADLSVDSAAFTLTFKTLDSGTAELEVTEAYVSESATALDKDADEALILNDTTVIKITGYTVTLPEEFKGDATVEAGKDYTFTAKDKNYDYEVTAKIGETEIPVTDNGDGTFTIAAKDITGNIVVMAEKIGKEVAVTLGDDMTGETKAYYMTAYTATLNKAAGYNYTVEVTIGGVNYTGFTYDNDTGLITIPGEAITGAIVFDTNKTAKTQDKHSVTISGNSGDVTAEQEATNGQDYTFTINKEVGYTYTVTATMNGETVEVIDNGDGTYTIQSVTGDLVITVTKTYDMEVEVKQYVTLNGKSMFLVTAKATVDESYALAYAESTMYYSEVYGAWSWLVITDSTLTVEDAKAQITLVKADKVALAATNDVNESGKVDINDAQLVFDMYNNEYQDFTVATMQKFLKADVSGDKKIDVNDAVAIVTAILAGK